MIHYRKMKIQFLNKSQTRRRRKPGRDSEIKSITILIWWRVIWEHLFLHWWLFQIRSEVSIQIRNIYLKRPSSSNTNVVIWTFHKLRVGNAVLRSTTSSFCSPFPYFSEAKPASCWSRGGERVYRCIFGLPPKPDFFLHPILISFHWN